MNAVTDNTKVNALLLEENTELKAQINKLRDVLDFYKWADKADSEWMEAKTKILSSTTVQSLATHNAAIEEEVIERSIAAYKKYNATVLPSDWNEHDELHAIRSQPRKYSGGE